MNDIKECEFTRGERIIVWYTKIDQYEEQIFLAYIDWATKPYICVDWYDEDMFIDWDTFWTTNWVYAKKKPKHSTEDIEKAKKLLIEAGVMLDAKLI